MKIPAKPFTFLTIMFFISVLGMLDIIESAEKRPLKRSRISKAYAGHDHDKAKDITVLMTVHPELAGTVLDDCRLCHCDGIWKKKYKNHCDYCHVSRHTKGYADTLNSYGKDYSAAGRSVKAMKSIESKDSDLDGIINSIEISSLTQPGESASRPNLKPAPSIILNPEKLAKIKRHSQFLLLNAHRASDAYATYSGWQMYDLLDHVGGLSNMSVITLISHDGFRKDYTKKDIYLPFTRCVFYGYMNTKDFLGDCPTWVKYPEKISAEIESGKEIPGEQRLILADQKNGKPLKLLHRNEQGKLTGEGPLRAIYPQISNAPPDQPMHTTSPDCPNPFDESIHHNAGDCARGVIAMIVHPLPEGTEEPDWQSQVDELLRSGSIMIFGAIKVENTVARSQNSE